MPGRETPVMSTPLTDSLVTVFILASCTRRPSLGILWGTPVVASVVLTLTGATALLLPAQNTHTLHDPIPVRDTEPRGTRHGVNVCV